MDTYSTGIINYYNYMKGYGFIRREKGKDVFFFFEDFVSENADVIRGDAVSFVIKKMPKGPRAFNIEIITKMA